LTGIEDPEAQRAKARALLQIGDLPSAGTAFTAIGDLDAANRTRLWNGDWMDLDPAAPEVWRLAADQAKPADGPADLGLLGRGGRSIDASLASREAIEALLATVPSPRTTEPVTGRKDSPHRMLSTRGRTPGQE
jgi:hypothetical protein